VTRQESAGNGREDRSRQKRGMQWGYLVAAIAFTTSLVALLIQIRTLLAWESTADGLREADAAIARLGSGETIAAKRWAIDRLVIVAAKHSELRSRIAERLADFVREQTAGDSIRSAILTRVELEADSVTDSMLEDVLNRDFPTPLLADYAFRQLGQAPFIDADRVDDDNLNLRDIVIPQARARNATFRHVDLSGAILVKAALADTRFESCNLTGCVLSRSSMQRCVVDDSSSIEKARFVGVKHERARIAGRGKAVGLSERVTK